MGYLDIEQSIEAGVPWSTDFERRIWFLIFVLFWNSKSKSNPSKSIKLTCAEKLNEAPKQEFQFEILYLIFDSASIWAPKSNVGPCKCRNWLGLKNRDVSKLGWFEYCIRDASSCLTMKSGPFKMSKINLIWKTEHLYQTWVPLSRWSEICNHNLHPTLYSFPKFKFH